MLCYKDRMFCASKIKKHTCGREYTKDDKVINKKINLPVAWGYFCGKPKPRKANK